jgi:hypothetical protein
MWQSAAASHGRVPNAPARLPKRAIANVKQFVESIRAGKYLHNAIESVESNVTPNDMLELNSKLQADLKTGPRDFGRR